MITAIYTLIIGSAVVVYVRMKRHVPSLATAIVVGLAAGGLPFVVTPFVRNGSSPSRRSSARTFCGIESC